jgi:hypothetical protein
VTELGAPRNAGTYNYPTNVVSWWSLDDPNAAAGSRGWGAFRNDGTYSGGLTFNGRAGLVFNGSSGMVTIADAPALDLTGSWGVWCSLKRGATGAVRTILSKGGSAYRLQLSSTGVVQMVANGVTILAAPSALDANQHAIAAYVAGANAAIYVDGVSVATSSTVATPAVANALPLRLGADTAAGGAAQAWFNGTLYGVALLAGAPNVGPMVLPALGPASSAVGDTAFLAIPALLTAYRDPADGSNLTATVDVLFGHGRQTLLGSTGTWGSADLVAGGTSGSFAIGADNHGTASLPFAPTWNGHSFDLQLSAPGAGSTSTTVELPASPAYGLARFLANLPLGDAVTALTVAPTLAVPANHSAVVFLRAATTPDQPAYAAGSTWTANPATAQAQLPAVAAYLAVQLQLVRTA